MWLFIIVMSSMSRASLFSRSGRDVVLRALVSGVGENRRRVALFDQRAEVEERRSL